MLRQNQTMDDAALCAALVLPERITKSRGVCQSAYERWLKQTATTQRASAPTAPTSLRDLFAAAAMEALLTGFIPKDGYLEADSIACDSYTYADAMMAERARRIEARKDAKA